MLKRLKENVGSELKGIKEIYEQWEYQQRTTNYKKRVKQKFWCWKNITGLENSLEGFSSRQEQAEGRTKKPEHRSFMIIESEEQKGKKNKEKWTEPKRLMLGQQRSTQTLCDTWKRNERERGREVTWRNRDQKLHKFLERHGYIKQEATQTLTRISMKRPTAREKWLITYKGASVR